MKYAQLLMGLLVGTALGGAAVSATLEQNAGAPDNEAIRAIVRDVIKTEPQLILDSVQAHQQGQQKQENAATNELLKKPEIQKSLFSDENSPSVGPVDAKNVVVEFFDYNCPACKMMFEGLDKLHAADKNVRIVFKEYPIFGPQSETNSKLGIAVHRIDPKKYFEFHGKMMAHKGRADEAQALGFIKEIGLDPAKVKAESETPEVAKILEAERALGGALKVQGTPTLVVNEEYVPHALAYEQLVEKLKK